MNKKQIVIFISTAMILLMIVFISSAYRKNPDDIGENNSSSEPIVVSGVDFAMDTVIEQKWYGDNAQKTYDETLELLRELEGQISLYVEGSEIDKLNKNSGGEFIKLSDDVFDILIKTKQISQGFNGYFDVTIAPISKLWDVTGENPKIPIQEEIDAALKLVNFEDIILDEQTKSAKLAKEGMAIDLGGIVKGIACDKIRELALKNNIERGYVSLGGNLMIIGDRPDGTDFVFGVRDPRGESNEYFGTVTIPEKIMATTGDYERFFEQDGKRYHHVFDPKTGYPADSDLISVTIISKRGILADFLSTTFFVYGKDAVLGNLENDNFDIIAVDKEKNVYLSKGIKDSFKPNKGNSEYKIIR